MSSINGDDLHRMFKTLDKNDDGQVSIDELKWLFDSVGVHTSLRELETLVGNNKTLNPVDFWVFYDMFVKKRDEREEGGHEVDDEVEEENKMEKIDDLVESFRVFDINGDGFISCDEVQSMLSRLGLWDGDCRGMIEFYDRNGDGLIDFDEFKSMMLLGSNSKNYLAQCSC